MDDRSYIIKPKDPSAIVPLQDPARVLSLDDVIFQGSMCPRLHRVSRPSCEPPRHIRDSDVPECSRLFDNFMYVVDSKHGGVAQVARATVS